MWLIAGMAFLAWTCGTAAAAELPDDAGAIALAKKDCDGKEPSLRWQVTRTPLVLVVKGYREKDTDPHAAANGMAEISLRDSRVQVTCAVEAPKTEERLFLDNSRAGEPLDTKP